MADEIIVIEKPEQIIEIVEANPEEEKTVVVTYDDEIKRFDKMLSKLDTRVVAQEGFNEGITFDLIEDSAIAREKRIPTDAKMAKVKKIGGMSQRTGDELITAKVESVKITGKNLLDWAKWSGIACNNAGIAVYDDANRSMTITAQDNADAYTRFDPGSFGNWLKVKPNTKYTLSWKSTATATGRAFLFENGTTANMSSALNNVGKVTITTTGTAEFLTFRVGAQNAGTTVKWENLQIEEGDTATDYAAFSKPRTIEIPQQIKDADIKGINDSVYDYIDIEHKRIVKRCGTYTIDDTSTIYSIEPRTNAIRIQYRINDAASGYTACVFSNLDYLKSWDSEETHGYMYNNTVRVILNGITTQADALTWLRNNPVTVVYELGSPIVSDISYIIDDEPIAQPFNCEDGYISFEQAQVIKLDIPNTIEYYVKGASPKVIADFKTTEETGSIEVKLDDNYKRLIILLNDDKAVTFATNYSLYFGYLNAKRDRSSYSFLGMAIQSGERIVSATIDKYGDLYSMISSHSTDVNYAQIGVFVTRTKTDTSVFMEKGSYFNINGNWDKSKLFPVGMSVKILGIK